MAYYTTVGLLIEEPVVLAETSQTEPVAELEEAQTEPVAELEEAQTEPVAEGAKPPRGKGKK